MSFIARGNFGDVSRVVNRRRGDRDEALKAVRVKGKTEKERQQNQGLQVDEVRVMLHVSSHPHVLQVLGCVLWAYEVRCPSLPPSRARASRG